MNRKGGAYIQQASYDLRKISYESFGQRSFLRTMVLVSFCVVSSRMRKTRMPTSFERAKLRCGILSTLLRRRLIRNDPLPVKWLPQENSEQIP